MKVKVKASGSGRHDKSYKMPELQPEFRREKERKKKGERCVSGLVCTCVCLHSMVNGRT